VRLLFMPPFKWRFHRQTFKGASALTDFRYSD